MTDTAMVNAIKDQTRELREQNRQLKSIARSLETISKKIPSPLQNITVVVPPEDGQEEELDGSVPRN